MYTLIVLSYNVSAGVESLLTPGGSSTYSYTTPSLVDEYSPSQQFYTTPSSVNEYFPSQQSYTTPLSVNEYLPSQQWELPGKHSTLHVSLHAYIVWECASILICMLSYI